MTSQSWKPITFVLLISILPPAILVAGLVFPGVFWQKLSLTWVAVSSLVWAWLISNITLRFFLSPLRYLPSPPNPSFLTGHGTTLFVDSGAQFLEWMKHTPNEGLIHFRSFFHRRSFVLVTSPEALREVVFDKVYDFEKPETARQVLHQIVGNGVLLAEGQEHRMQRKAVAPAFQGKHIKELIPMFWGKSREMTQVMSEQISDGQSSTSPNREGVVEINVLASRATLDIIGVAALGYEFGTLRNSEDELARNYETLTDPSTMGLFWMLNLTLSPRIVKMLPWKMNTRVADATANVGRITKQLLDDKRTLLKQDSTAKHVDILSVMLNSSVPLSDQVLVDQLLTFLAAGHETTASALAWSMYLIAKHVRFQDTLRAELKRTLGEDLQSASSNIFAIDSIPLLSAFCNESLRLWPTVPNTGRNTLRDTTILGHAIPAGTQIMMSMWMMNRLPSLWGADAGEFKPERWLGEENANTGGAMSTLAFTTFHHGPRSCIGQGFARAELKCLVAAMVLRFHIEMADENEVVKPGGAITIKPKDGLRLRLREL